MSHDGLNLLKALEEEFYYTVRGAQVFTERLKQPMSLSLFCEGSVVTEKHQEALQVMGNLFSLKIYFLANMLWSSQSAPFGFGTEDRTEGVMKHMESEIAEVRRAAPGSVERLEELCDLFILTLDAVWRGGYTFEQLTEQLLKKQQKNFKRTWPAMPPDKAAFHNRDAHEGEKEVDEKPELHH